MNPNATFWHHVFKNLTDRNLPKVPVQVNVGDGLLMAHLRRSANGSNERIGDIRSTNY